MFDTFDTLRRVLHVTRGVIATVTIEELANCSQFAGHSKPRAMHSMIENVTYTRIFFLCSAGYYVNGAVLCSHVRS